MDPRRRGELTRYGAPAAFLAAVTIAVVLIKSGLSGGGGNHAGSRPTTALPTTTHRATTTQRTTTATTAAARYYTIQPGDTLGVVAGRERTTVEELLRLNPGIDPKALHSGQRIRVG